MINKDGKHTFDLLSEFGVHFLLGSIDDFDISKMKFKTLEHNHLGPDLIGYSDSTIYGIEHFKVDASYSDKKGSSIKREYNEKIEKENEEKLNKSLTEVSSIYTKIKSDIRYEYLKKNICSSFLKHYEKIPIYRKNLKQLNKKIEIIFFIEYDLVLPSILVDKISGSTKGILPHFDIDFLSFFSDKYEISGLVFNYSEKNFYLPILEEYKEDGEIFFDCKKYDIEDFPININTVSIKIPKF